MDDCLFCKIAKGEIDSSKVYEDEDVFVFLDIKPISKGHTLVIPKKHSVNIEDIEEKDLLKCVEVIKKIAPKIKKALGADGFNIGNNNHSAAGQVIMHTHFHIIPRYENDGLKNWPNLDTTEEELKQTHSKIVKYLKE